MIALAAVLVAVAVALLVPSPPEPRIRRMLPAGGGALITRSSRLTMSLATTVATVLAAVGAMLVLGGPAGIGAAVVCVLVVPRITRNLESRSTRERRDRLSRQAPVLVDLLSATLSSGASMRSAVRAASAAVGEPASDALRPVVAALDLGADPVEAWSVLGADPVLAPVVAAVVRSARTGAALSSVLGRIADDLRRERQIAVEVAARAAGVKAVAPLAACFLPAFLLLGVVPVVASLAGQLLS